MRIKKRLSGWQHALFGIHLQYLKAVQNLVGESKEVIDVLDFLWFAIVRYRGQPIFESLACRACMHGVALPCASVHL